MRVHDFVPAEPTEGAGAVEVLQGGPEVLALPVIDEAADEGLLKPSETSQSRCDTSQQPSASPGPQATHPISEAQVLCTASHVPQEGGTTGTN